MSEQADSKRWIWGLIVIIVVVVSGGAYQAWKRGQPRQIKVRGTIKQIDAANRTATLEFIHPRNGQLIAVAGEVSPGCEIVVDGKPATLETVHEGDPVTVMGDMTRFPSVKVAATSINVTHAATTMPAPDAPASAQAGQGN